MPQGNPNNRNQMRGGYGRVAVPKNNPKNRESPLYVALTRLFSGPITNYRQQAQIRYKRRDLDRFKFTLKFL